jgi:hypothetical protein
MFSHQGQMGHDTPLTYASGVANNDLMKSATFLANNPGYDVEAAQETPSNVKGMAVFRNHSAARERSANAIVAWCTSIQTLIGRFGNLSNLKNTISSEAGKEIVRNRLCPFFYLFVQFVLLLEAQGTASSGLVQTHFCD